MTFYTQRAFTLLELLVVLVIAGFALSIVGPRVSGLLPEVQLRSETGKVISLLRQAHSLAMAQGRVVSVEVDSENAVLRISGVEHAHQWSPTVHVESSTSSGPQLYFYPDGSSNGGNLIVRQGTSLRKIKVNWLTGKVYQDE